MLWYGARELGVCLGEKKGNDTVQLRSLVESQDNLKRMIHEEQVSSEYEETQLNARTRPRPRYPYKLG